MNRPSDWRERERGRDPQHSYIVQAPAGSGKTELLTQRMLGLLSRVQNPEEVVAITFTRKAAAEMSHRLINCLRAAAGADDDKTLQVHEKITRDLALMVLRSDAERNWNLLEHPSRLRIRTIDSLCSELARQLPVLSGLGGRHKIAEDPDSLYRLAAERTMAVIEDDSDELQADVVRVLDRYDNQYDRLVDLLTNMLGHREQWIKHLLDARRGHGFDRSSLEEALRYLIELQLGSTAKNIPENLLNELPRFYRWALANAPVDEVELKALLDASGGIDCEVLDLPTDADSLQHWVIMANRLITADGKKWRAGADAKAGFPAPSGARGEEKALRKVWKDDYAALLDQFRDNDGLREQLITVRTLPSADYDDEAWESLQSLMRILLRAAAEWKLVMTQSGELDYTEVATRAIDSLGPDDMPSNLALRMDYRIQHLLVDEFQDTSNSQIQLLRKLTAGWSDGDGRTLFLVGDPMQSIYRFRKAEVSLFIQACQGQLFEHINLQTLQLSVNFRSTRPIVNWVNQQFPKVMPPQSDPVMGAVSYSQSSTKPGVSQRGGVVTRIFPERDDAEEARQVIKLIEQSEADEKIAILVRSRSHASEILALLDRLKEDQPRYRYQAVKFNPLAETPLIQDLVSLTLALLQPADRLAWLATLRTPFAGLDLADLDELVSGNSDAIILDAIATGARPDDDTADGRYSKDENGPMSLSETARLRLQRIGPALLEAVNLRGRQSVRTLVESTWTHLGGPACANNASELSDAATYFKLLESLEDEQLPIDRDTLDLRMKNLYAEPDANAGGHLQVLTIYASKGLQFDTVILPGLNRSTAGDKPKLLHWFELAQVDGIVLSPMRNEADKEKKKHAGDLIRYIANIEKQRQCLEDGRLLYVATTRAIANLYLFGAVSPKANGDIEAKSGTLLGELWPAISTEQTPLIRQAAEQQQDAMESNMDGDVDGDDGPGFPQDYRRLAADWRLPACPEPTGLESPGLMPDLAEPRDYIEFRWAGEDARLTGNLVHRLLQVIGDRGIEAWHAGGGISRLRNWCRQKLISEGVKGKKAEAIITRAARAIDNCLASRRGQWILQPHDQAQCEHAITALVDGQAGKMVLDRTFIEEGTRWIIDYKTSSHAGGDLEGFLDNEAERYREQMLRYRDAMAINENRPIRSALYFPLLDRFREL